MLAREKYQSLSVEERRALVARRDPEKVREVDRQRYERDKPKRRAAMDAYAAEHPEVLAAGARRYRERNPEKRAAHTAVGNALRSGRLVKGPCEREAEGGCSAPIHGHHDDYSKPLEVRWLCAAHHAVEHKLRRMEAA